MGGQLANHGSLFLELIFCGIKCDGYSRDLLWRLVVDARGVIKFKDAEKECLGYTVIRFVWGISFSCWSQTYTYVFLIS